jgi:hypothetical protein
MGQTLSQEFTCTATKVHTALCREHVQLHLQVCELLISISGIMLCLSLFFVLFSDFYGCACVGNLYCCCVHSIILLLSVRTSIYALYKHWKISFVCSLCTKREPIYYGTVCTQFIMSNKLPTRNLHLLEVNFSLLGNTLGCG